MLQELWSLKCQKRLIICIFCWWQQKNSHSLDKLFKCTRKILFSSSKKFYALLGFELPISIISSLENTRFWIFCWLSSFYDTSTLNILRTETPKPINHTIFMKELNKIFQRHSNVLPTLWLIFCCHQQKIQKMSLFDILVTITPGVNMITRQLIPFFLSTLWAPSVGIFYFCISRSLKLNSMGLSLKLSCMGLLIWIMFWSIKITFMF